MPQQQPPDTDHATTQTYDWEMVLTCGLALLLQSVYDGEAVRALLARATGPEPDAEAMDALRAYVRRTLEPLKGMK